MTTQTFSERMTDKIAPTSTTVNRRDISLNEEVLYCQEGLFGAAVLTPVSSTWYATLDGRLSTGEEAHLERWGTTSSEDLANLEAAIKENGWEIR